MAIGAAWLRKWAAPFAALVVGVLAGCGGGGTAETAPAAPPNAVASVEVRESSILLTGPGQSRKLTVDLLDASGAATDATVSWTSSAPDRIRVDADGVVHNVTPLGSAVVFAEAGGFRSKPVFVASVELHPGTMLVRDVEVVRVDPPLTAGADDYPGIGTRYDVWLSVPAAPAIGQIVLAAETAAVAGRVVETAPDAGLLRVRLEVLGAPDLLARYDVDWSFDLTDYPLVAEAGTAAAATRPAPAAARGPLADRAIVPEWKIPSQGSSPLECEASIKAFLKSKPVEAKITGSPRLEVLSSRLDASLPPGRLRIALVGPLLLETKIGLTAEAGLTGSGKCELKGRIPLPVLPPPIGPLVHLAIPVGIGASVSGTVEVASLDISLEGKNGAQLELGIDCRPAPAGCSSLDRAERINEFKPHLEVHGAQMDGLKIELEAMAYFLTGLDVVFVKPFNIVDVKVGPKQSASFATVKRQVEQGDYASSYDLKFKIEASPGSDLKKAIDTLMGGEDRGGPSFSLGAQADISESPNGVWDADKKTNVVPDRDTVTFTVDLKPPSLEYFLLAYNVTSIEIWRKVEGEMDFRPVASVPVSASMQQRFQWQWSPTALDAGTNTFAAFVRTTLPVLDLEIAPDSRLEVKVSCFSGAGSSRATAQAVRTDGPATCADTWVGPSSYRIKTVGKPDDYIAADATVTWTLDLARSSDAIVHYKPSGTFALAMSSSNGCTFALSPHRFTIAEDPLAPSQLQIFRGGGMSRYSFIGQQRVDFTTTATCPGRDPVETEFRGFLVSWGVGEGPVEPGQTTLSGHFDDPAITSTWRFDRP